MPAIDEIHDFLTRITPVLEHELAATDPPSGLIVVEDEGGTVIADATSSPFADHDLLMRHVESGAHGAAYINYLADRDEAFARVLLGQPLSSDTRRAAVIRTSTHVTVGSWEHVITG